MFCGACGQRVQARGRMGVGWSGEERESSSDGVRADGLERRLEGPRIREDLPDLKEDQDHVQRDD